MCGKAQYENKCDSPVPLLKENCSLIKSCSTLQAPSLSWPLFRHLTAIAVLIAFFYHFLSTTPTTPANAAPVQAPDPPNVAHLAPANADRLGHDVDAGSDELELSFQRELRLRDPSEEDDSSDHSDAL